MIIEVEQAEHFLVSGLLHARLANSPRLAGIVVCAWLASSKGCSTGFHVIKPSDLIL
jgi:hypothetical protein